MAITSEPLFEIRIYPPMCEPWNTFNERVAKQITGNKLRALLRRKIDGCGVLNVSCFNPYCKSFKREFIDPCLDDDGYAHSRVFTIHSNNLDRDVTYRVVVVSYSDKVRDANDNHFPKFLSAIKGLRRNRILVNELIEFL